MRQGRMTSSGQALYSEDFQDGQRLEGMLAIRNPLGGFSPAPSV
jgi:predicted nucleic acid-binding protein